MADWQKGDMALCLKQGPWSDIGFAGPRAGQVFTVSAVAVRRGILSLLIRGDWRNPWFVTSQFRKITPGADIEGVEAERRVKEPA
jgi:hypothetical protein